MTFEQWAEEMKKGISLLSDEDPKSLSSNDDRSEGELWEEEPTYNSSQNS